MALFVVRHAHSAETCPAQDPRMGAMLLQHLSPANAQQNGVNILGDAVVNGAHTLYMIVEAPGEAEVSQYMAPFAQAGSVEVMPASHCEQVVSRGGC